MAQLGARGPFTVLEPAVDATGLNRPGAALDAGAPEVSRGPSNAVGPGALQSSAYRNFTRRGEAPWGLTSQLGTVSTTTGSKGLVMDKKTCMAVGMGGRCVQGCQGARVHVYGEDRGGRSQECSIQRHGHGSTLGHHSKSGCIQCGERWLAPA